MKSTIKLFLKTNAVFLLFTAPLLAMGSGSEEKVETRKGVLRQHPALNKSGKAIGKPQADKRGQAVAAKAAAAPGEDDGKKAAAAPILGEEERRSLLTLRNNLEGFKDHLGEFEPITADLADQKPRAETLVRDMFSRNNLSPQVRAEIEAAKKKFDEAFAQLPEIQAFQTHMQEYFHTQFERLRKAPTDPLDSENWAMIRSAQEGWIGICNMQEIRQKNDYVASLKISRAFIDLLRAINPDMETWAPSDVDEMRAVDQLLKSFSKQTQGK